MGIWAECTGCIIIIIPYFWLRLERVACIHFCQLFWSSSSGTFALCWRSSNLFTLSCLGMIIFIWTFPCLRFFFLLLPIVILETLFCGRKQFSAAVLPQDKYWSFTIMQQPTPWDALLEVRLTMHDRSRRNRFNQTAWQNQAHYSNFDDQLCNWSTIKLLRNGAKHKCKLLKICQAQMWASRLGKRNVQDNALKPWGTLTWMSQLSQKGIFKWSWYVLSMPWKSLENKEGWWEICHFTSTQKIML